jgi:inosine/xanthosine triphosphatase
MRINVGTRNQLKVAAARAAFAAVFPESKIEAHRIAVASTVPSQPFDEQVVGGAMARARAALLDADYGVGIEAGLVSFPGCKHPLSVQFCAIVDREGEMSVGHGPGYALHERVLARLKAGSTLNREMSDISGIDEIKEKMGTIGYLSSGLVDRFTITREAVVMALIPRLDRWA